MIGHELGIEQGKAPGPQPRHQMDQRHLRRIGFVMKHAFAKEGAAKPNTIEATNKPTLPPRLHGVTVSDPCERAVKRPDAPVDPRAPPPRGRRGTGVDHRLEIMVHTDLEMIRPHGSRQSLRHAKPIQRDNAAPFRFDPVKAWIIGTLGHGKNPAGVGLQEHVGGNGGDQVVGRSGHGTGPQPKRHGATVRENRPALQPPCSHGAVNDPLIWVF